MTSWQRFSALWTHRRKKINHIANKYYLFGRDYIELSRLKESIGDRKLIAILLSEQFGDIVACEPIAEAVRKLHPNDHIIWVVRKPYVELVERNPHINGYLVEYCVSHRIKLMQSGIFDKYYNLHLSHRNCYYCGDDHVNPIADAKNLTYANYYFHGDLLHVFSQAAGLPALEGQPQLYPSKAVREKVASLNLPTNAIVVHCLPSYAERGWRPELWNQLVAWLLDTFPYPVIEIGLENQITLTHPRYINLCNQLTILETSEVIRHSQLFIGIDSGPAHLAHATGVDAIILLGKTRDFTEYMPYSGRYKRGEGLTILNRVGYPCADLPYEWVQQAVEEKLQQAVAN
ncbi:glycosyltransferase family 9 protein [Tellurirhabdus bombi]|uniref:glycosyltransferase family 9 protein n=1 Tax=Tellurirhabdus bombi TaxID=2907205 RepID=UPI001F1E15C7|nr:glycosyltransferase family 9 protein [Tellurirhabdus bombi]